PVRSLCFLITRHSPTSTLFPYTTLFRSLPTAMRRGIVVTTREPERDPAARPEPGGEPEEPGQGPADETRADRVMHPDKPHASARSEEHTSELQSRFDLVCRLLLEKKNPA